MTEEKPKAEARRYPSYFIDYTGDTGPSVLFKPFKDGGENSRYMADFEIHEHIKNLELASFRAGRSNNRREINFVSYDGRQEMIEILKSELESRKRSSPDVFSGHQRHREAWHRLPRAFSVVLAAKDANAAPSASQRLSEHTVRLAMELAGLEYTQMTPEDHENAEAVAQRLRDAAALAVSADAELDLFE